MRTREKVSALVIEHWEAMVDQGWRNPNATIIHYMRHPDELDRDLALQERIRAHNAPVTGPQQEAPNFYPAPYAAIGHQFQRLYADGKTFEEIQALTTHPKHGPWSMYSIKKWCAVPRGKTPGKVGSTGGLVGLGGILAEYKAEILAARKTVRTRMIPKFYRTSRRRTLL